MPTKPVDDDFDAFFAEHLKPYRFKLLGQVWELPHDVPAATVLRYERLIQLIDDLPDDDDAEVQLPDGITVADLTFESFLRGLAGDQMVDQWIAAGLTPSMFGLVAQHLVGRYIHGDHSKLGQVAQGKAPRAPQDRKAPAKKKTPTRRSTSSGGSSSTGGSSKQGGKPSTADTSPTT